MQTVFSDAVLFLGVKQMQMSKFNTHLLQRKANFMYIYLSSYTQAIIYDHFLR